MKETPNCKPSQLLWADIPKLLTPSLRCFTSGFFLRIIFPETFSQIEWVFPKKMVTYPNGDDNEEGFDPRRIFESGGSWIQARESPRGEAREPKRANKWQKKPQRTKTAKKSQKKRAQEERRAKKRPDKARGQGRMPRKRTLNFEGHKFFPLKTNRGGGK